MNSLDEFENTAVDWAYANENPIRQEIVDLIRS